MSFTCFAGTKVQTLTQKAQSEAAVLRERVQQLQQELAVERRAKHQVRFYSQFTKCFLVAAD